MTLIFATSSVVPGVVTRGKAGTAFDWRGARRACINESRSISSEVKRQVLGSGRPGRGLPAAGVKPGTGP